MLCKHTVASFVHYLLVCTLVVFCDRKHIDPCTKTGLLCVGTRAGCVSQTGQLCVIIIARRVSVDVSNVSRYRHFTADSYLYRTVHIDVSLRLQDKG